MLRKISWEQFRANSIIPTYIKTHTIPLIQKGTADQIANTCWRYTGSYSHHNVPAIWSKQFKKFLNARRIVYNAQHRTNLKKGEKIKMICQLSQSCINPNHMSVYGAPLEKTP